MFDTLTERLTHTFKNLRGHGRFTEANIDAPLRDVRLSLIEADVALPVVQNFIEQVKQNTLGQEVATELSPDQAFIKTVHQELVRIMGDEHAPLNFKTQPPAVFLLAGLQGSGKTTSAAKLARHLKEHEHKKVMLVSVDVYRPAAINQLEILAQHHDIAFFPASTDESPVEIARNALDRAKKQFMDVLIIDTAGRLHVDAEMMQEIKSINKAVSPIETLFVIDSMTGQDAVNTAQAFHEALPLTGVILTKTDGDARGGAALSVRQITGKPIKFIGSGEKIDALEPFHPERVASRLLGMGDILTLIEEIERKADKKAGERLAKKIKKGYGFDLEDFRDQLLQMNQMGGISSMLSKLPGMQAMPAGMPGMSEKAITQIIAIINSMTIKERRFPKIIMNSRTRRDRITQGSGTKNQDLARLIKQYEQMQKMMKKFSKPGAMQKMMRGVSAMPGLKNMLPGGFKK